MLGVIIGDKVTEITHNHPEGMKGARAATHAIWLARVSGQKIPQTFAKLSRLNMIMT